MEYPNIWAEIDLDAIAANVRELRRKSPAAEFMAVVKADGYGHGAVEIARTAIENGATCLGVARMGEAIPLREAGITVPILIFGYTHPSLSKELVAYDLTQALYSREIASRVSRQLAGTSKTLKVHVKIDTGMGRLGLVDEGLIAGQAGPGTRHDAVSDVKEISGMPGLSLSGIMTHFASADSADQTHVREQTAIFKDFLNRLSEAGVNPGTRHAANSAALIDLPESHLDMVRAGISLYGLRPSGEMNMNDVKLTPAMTLKARIAYLKTVPPGFKVSYGSTHITKETTTLASIPVGYADGFNRLLSSRGHMLVRGKRAPITGRVCMDQTLIDVGHIPDASIDDEVVIMGRQEGEEVSADEIAETLCTINYEVVSTVMARVPRIYINKA